MALDDIPIWLPLLLFLPLLLLMKKKMDDRSQNKCLPPSPPILPIIGNLHQLGELPHQSLCQLSKQYGPVMLLKLGGIPTVIISSAEAAREALKVHDLDCCSRPTFASSRRILSNYGAIAFAPYGDYWKEMRKSSVLELFSVKRVQSNQFIREEEVDLLVNSICHSSSSATPIDLSKKLSAFTANVSSRMAFGNFCGSDLDIERFREVVHEIEAMLGSFNPSEYFPFMGWIMDKFSRRFQRKKQEHEGIIDLLLRKEREQIKSGDARFTKQNIKAVLMVLFVGTVDSVTTTMIWAMTELAKNPRGISYAKLANLPPIVGLYSSFVPPLVYAVLGSSRDLAVGPVSIASLILGSMLRQEVSPNKDPLLFLQLAFSSTFFAGLFQASLGLLRLGFIIDFLSKATLIGFMAGVAITVSLQQLKSLLGITNFTKQMGLVPVLSSVFHNRKEWSWQTIVMGFCFLVLLLVFS
ncbi:hypothetical protein CMV_003563 [Castanea mollissima]|uniref:SLC26A/SulP transporter domain-containing protein n=1 Tax=Castanea mollissima TaxID=60419 RepID=A0A8J4VW45_9ROSI|nr:hypothetical protein CMV_003563 [Castanea mollissima]